MTSRSTEQYDMGEKFEHYKTLPSLRQYVLVSHKERAITIRTRSEEWQQTVIRDGEAASFSIGARIDVRELYDSAAE